MTVQGVPRPTGSRDVVVLAILVFFLASMFFGDAVYAYVSGTQATPISPPGPPPIGATLNISSMSAGVISPSFWGLNLRADQEPTPSMLSYVTSTPVKMLRWPGGNLAERYNMTANGGAGLIYNDDGSSVTPAWTTAQFVTWCESINCQSIFTVPAEIDNPSLAASYVAYVEGTLGFHPTYWEIGNEPDLWTHFDIPWTRWSTLQQTGATPAAFADIVHSYIEAMKLVDTNIRFIGLGGVGGSGGEAPWISAVVGENGPNLTAIALHYYPAGSGTAGESDSHVYSTVNGTNSLSIRYARDQEEIDSACPSCNIQVIVDEFGVGTGSNLDSFMSGFQIVPYITAELEQGMYLNLSTMNLWVLESTYPGSMFDPSGNAHPVSILYSTILPLLDSIVLRTTVLSGLPNLYAISTENVGLNPSTTLLIANLNTTYSASIQLAGSGFPLSGSGTALMWDSQLSVPQSRTLISSVWVLPPESIGLWIGDAPVSSAVHAPHANPLPITWAMHLSPSLWGPDGNGGVLSAVPTRPE